MTSYDAKFVKLQAQFQSLSKVASSLNSASDELTKKVSVFDEALRRMNVGLEAWVNYASYGYDVDPAAYDSSQIGYAKVQGKWGIALRRIWGSDNFDRHEQEGPWLFNDAPREMRILGSDKLPELIEELARIAAKTTEKLKEKSLLMHQFTVAIGGDPSKSEER